MIITAVFYPRVESVDGNGNINWNTPKGGLSEGTYEFYLFQQMHGIIHLILTIPMMRINGMER